MVAEKIANLEPGSPKDNPPIGGFFAADEKAWRWRMDHRSAGSRWAYWGRENPTKNNAPHDLWFHWLQ
jgi:hypothetical protein